MDCEAAQMLMLAYIHSFTDLPTTLGAMIVNKARSSSPSWSLHMGGRTDSEQINKQIHRVPASDKC